MSRISNTYLVSYGRPQDYFTRRLRKISFLSIPRPITWCRTPGASSRANLGIDETLAYSIKACQVRSARVSRNRTGTYTDKVRITWSASSGATFYEVWRAISVIGIKIKIGTPSTTFYDDTSAFVGATYYYWVTAKNSYGTSGYSSYNTGYSCPDCSGGTIENFTFKSGTNCECATTGPLTIGPGVTIESGATVTFESPSIKVQSGFHTGEGAKVFMKQP
jgi:acetyltransferase-like isoleucine patch superfamily enzyme